MTSINATAPVTVQQAIQYAQEQCGLPRLDAQMLLLHACGLPPHDRAWLLTHGDEVLDATSHTLYLDFLRRRQGHEPLAYITGFKEFFGLQLQVDKIGRAHV